MKPEARRRVGRPRANAAPVAGDPVDEILAVAGRLFGELGVGPTSMTRIAKDAGLRQSSLYYYFRGKDELVAALVARANVVPVELVREVVAAGGSPSGQLYRFVVGDVVALGTLPFDINEIHRVAGRDPDRFADYWREREVLIRKLSHIVRRGVADGELRDVHVRRTALTVLANDEGTQNWYRSTPGVSLARIASEMADLTVGGLLAPGMTLEAVRSEAGSVDRSAL